MTLFRRLFGRSAKSHSRRRLQAARRGWIAQAVERLEGRRLMACLSDADLALSSSSIDENLPAGTTVGIVSTINPDPDSDSYVYSFEGGPENLDNEQFFLTGDAIKTRSSFDFESISSYQVGIKSTDTDGNAVSKMFTINVNDLQEAPVAQDDAVLTMPNTPVSGNVLANDTDDAGDTLTASVAVEPINGTLELNADGSFTYTPNADFLGSDSFTYLADDGQGGTDTATVTIVVDGINDSPVAADDVAETDEDMPVNGNVLVNDTDADGDALVATLSDGPASGTLELNSNGSYIYTPNADFHGEDSFSYTVDDGHGGTATGILTITVNPINDAPSVVDDAAMTDEDTPVSGNVLLNDSDADGDALVATLNEGPTNGTLELSPDGSFSYMPSADFYGVDSFTYMADDGNGATAMATVTITVNPVDDGPVAVDDAATTDEDVAAVIPIASLLSNDGDPEGEIPTFVAASGAVNGTVAVSGGNVIFTPDPDFNGTGSFEYAIQDASGGFAFATVTVSVNAVADAPVAVDDSATTVEDMPITIPASDLLSNDSDADGDALTVLAVGGVEGGSVELADGNVTFTPAAGFQGTGTFDYIVSDGTTGGFALGQVSVKVTGVPVNDLPIAADDAIDALEGETAMIAAADLLANDVDADGDMLAITAVGDAVNGTVELSGDEIAFMPDAGFTGTATFTYTIDDGQGGTDTGAVTVNVNPEAGDPELNTPPVLRRTGSNTFCYVNDDPIVPLGNRLAAAEAEGNFDGGKLELSVTSGEHLSNRLFFCPTGDFSISGAELMHRGVTIATISDACFGDAWGQNELAFTFNANATLSHIQHMMPYLGFRTNTETGGACTDPRIIEIKLTDSLGACSISTATVEVS